MKTFNFSSGGSKIEPKQENERMPLNLASLPPDIVKKIIGMEKESIDEMRLISPSWNEKVLACRQSHTLPLERLYIHSGESDPSDDYEGLNSYERAQKLMRVHIHAIVPEESSHLIGIGKWMKVHSRYTGPHSSDKAIEVTCEPLKIWGVLGIRDIFGIISVFAFLIFIGTIFINSGRPPIVGLAVAAALALLAISGFFIFANLCMRAANAQPRLNRFISLFTHIETFVVDLSRDWGGINHFLPHLGNFRVDHLEIREMDCNEKMPNPVIIHARNHSIRHLSIVASQFHPEVLGPLLLKLCKMGIAVSIYEKGYHQDVRMYFRRPVQFWDDLARDLLKDNVSFHLSHLHEPGFNTDVMNTHVRAIIRCKPNDPFVVFPPPTSRGFYKK